MRLQIHSGQFLVNTTNPNYYTLTKLSKIISLVINPLVVAPFTFGLIVYNDQTLISKHLIFSVSILFTNILPLLTILYYRKVGKLSAFDAPLREQRVELLVIAAMYYAVGFIFLEYLGASLIVKGLMFCYAINTAVVWRITRYWKISIHMVGIGGPIVAIWFSGFQYPILMGSIVVLVGLARILLKAHTPAQVVTGTVLAMGLAYIELKLLFL